MQFGMEVYLDNPKVGLEGHRSKVKVTWSKMNVLQRAIVRLEVKVLLSQG